MSSKREEERNEKIIRGLMKLPPNRKCINCNSLGPQYVCTNFWTFVCMTCSGIHREFTHRVKSVSMAKFTSQEVDALQKGGNQRARETYLVHWNPQRQKQPNSSNAEKVREFIRHVYVDKKYAADKPPRDTENLRHPEEETRRASSYHSYSQSPPYDTQYEERRYGKQLPVLTRKPGSDRGLYDGKVSNFSSPSRFSDQALERSRASDFSISSPIHSPNSLKDARVRSPSYQKTDNTAKENAERVRCTQRPTSSSSFGSFDSNSLSFKSNNSITLADLVSAPEIIQDKQYPNLSLQKSATGNFGGLDLFDTPYAPNNITQSPPVDLFQLPNAQSKAPVDLFEPNPKSSVPNVHAQKPSPQQAPPVTTSKKSSDNVVQKNEGWATFDFPPNMPPKPSFADSAPPDVPTNGSYSERIDTLPMPNTALPWPSFESSNIHEPLSIHSPTQEPKSIHNQWHGEPYKAHEPSNTGQWPVFEGSNVHEDTSKQDVAYELKSMNNQWHGEPYKSQVSFTNSQQPWDAFEDPTRQLSHSSTHQIGQEVVGQAQFTTMDQHLGDINETGLGRGVFESRPPISSVPFHVEAYSHALERKSSNPFDLSDDFDFQSGNAYLDMTSLQAAPPTGQLPNSFVNDVSQSWFVHDPAPHYIPAAHQGSVGYIGGPAPNVQMPNVATQEPVASIGGNPFA